MIYFAANNIISDTFYSKSCIIGETNNLIRRQTEYSYKGISVQTGTISNYMNEKGLAFPFVTYFNSDLHDRDIHLLMLEKPFRDIVYKLPYSALNTKEAFAFYSESLDIKYNILRLKDLILASF
jgi:predicted transglutaminase-like protease